MRLAQAVAEAEKIVTLPEEWCLRFDAEDEGLVRKWHQDQGFADWDRMRIDQHWTAQGDEPYGPGVALLLTARAAVPHTAPINVMLTADASPATACGTG